MRTPEFPVPAPVPHAPPPRAVPARRTLARGRHAARVALRGFDWPRALGVLLRHVPLLDRILHAQAGLRPGDVTPEETARRLRPAARVSAACQCLAVRLRRAGRFAELACVGPVRERAERILRENPLLWARGPLDVVRFCDIVPRYVLNARLEREQRLGWGLHRGNRNELGPSVVLALTPPGHEHLLHQHPVDEHTLVLDEAMDGVYLDGERRVLPARDGDLLRFAAGTVHALANRGLRAGRSLTVKMPSGLLAWAPYTDGEVAPTGRAERVGPARAGGRRGTVTRRYRILTTPPAYAVELRWLAPGQVTRWPGPSPEHLLVLSGRVRGSVGRHGVEAGPNDLLVLDGTRPARLRAGPRGARLYRVVVGG